MSDLIPFHVPTGDAVSPREPAERSSLSRVAARGPHELAVIRGGSVTRTRSTGRTRRARRWDPAFHVDLLQF